MTTAFDNSNLSYRLDRISINVSQFIQDPKRTKANTEQKKNKKKYLFTDNQQSVTTTSSCCLLATRETNVYLSWSPEI